MLRFISSVDIRRTIRAETRKSKATTTSSMGLIGGPVIKSGDPVEQEKQLKYASLVANAIMLSNVADLTEALAAMAEDGQPVTPGLVACLSPYMREHIRRFGQCGHGDARPSSGEVGKEKEDGPKTGTAVGERGHFGVVGSANGAKALSDQRRDIGVSLGDCSEHLPTSTRSFDIADANLQVTFALFAAADERRIHADSDQCCRSCWLASGCNSKLRADPQRMVAQCLRAPASVNW